MHDYKVAAGKHVYKKKYLHDGNVGKFESELAEKQFGGPPHSSYSRGNTGHDIRTPLIV